MKRNIIIALVGVLALAACSAEPSPTNKERQANKAAQAANSIQFDQNAEIDNIKRRLELTSDPAAEGYILLMNQMAQPVAYYGVVGKVTSSGKRLTRPDESGCAAGDCSFRAAASDEGTYGSSDPYIYFWDSAGAYHQWNGLYLYSDKPFRTTTPPLVVSTAQEK